MQVAGSVHSCFLADDRRHRQLHVQCWFAGDHAIRAVLPLIGDRPKIFGILVDMDHKVCVCLRSSFVFQRNAWFDSIHICRARRRVGSGIVFAGLLGTKKSRCVHFVVGRPVESSQVRLLRYQGPKIFQEVEIVPGCVLNVACPSCPDYSPEPLGTGRVIRNMLGWSKLEETERSGVWVFRGLLQGENLFSSISAAGAWVRKGSCPTAWAVPCDPSCTGSDAYGHGPAIGPHTGERCRSLLAGLWRAIAPLMKPWCAEGEVPTAANLNLHRGWRSCVGWHSDDEPLFGECGDAKLIVSVSLGRSALFRWRRQSCPDDEGHLCWHGHGDIRVMDGQCQDEFLHRTDPGREQERINLTFRWVKQHASPVLRLRQEWHVVCQRVRTVHQFLLRGILFLRFGGLLVCPWRLVHMESSSLAGPVVYKTWVTEVCLLLDTPFWRGSVGALPL